MNLYHLKMHLKRNKLIKGIYDKLIGSKKTQEETMQKRRALQESGVDMLRAVEDALGATNARFFLEYGSLLGMVRDGHFIGHDDDIDFAIYIDDAFGWEDLEKTLCAAGMKKKKQFTLRGEITEQTYQLGNLTADFFRHYEEENISYSYSYYRKDGYLYNSPYEYHGRLIAAHKTTGITTMTACDATFHIPTEAETYLASIYGPAWRIPDPNWDDTCCPDVRELNDVLAIIQYI